MTYGELSIPARSLVQLALFMIVCAGGVLTGAMFFRRKAAAGALALGCAAVSAVWMVVYTADARSKLRILAMPQASEWLCARPVWLPLAWILLAGGLCAYLFRDEWRYHRNTITRFSIRDGVDKISSGLCFFEAGGRVILANSRMNELSHRIAGCELANAEQFWKTLSGGRVLPGVERLSYGSYPDFRLPDGSVWTFSRERLEGFIQLTAADTTLQQSLTDELREKNLDLAAMNLRLRRYGENVDGLARARERLETKARIHGELGQALLMTRRYLVSAEGQEPPLDVWRRNIAILRHEIEAGRTGDPLRILWDAAEAAGVGLRVEGDLPESEEERQFFLAAVSEAMTNAVFHAGAGNLLVRRTETERGWTLRITNDGAPPASPVSEGGGLSSLRRKAEYIGAVMTVRSAPEFELSFEGRKGGAR